MKNTHGVEPTRYMKREEIEDAIDCDLERGPQFGKNTICIDDNCNNEDSCMIGSSINFQYECHPEYKSSLFVNTGGHYEKNYFTVLDYEVFGIYNKDYVYNVCKHPDIIMKHIETKDISEESLKQVDDSGLLNDSDAIHCEDSDNQLKVSHYYLKNPSEFLPDTQLVNQQYDDILREWCGDYQWRLLYRASEHEYTARSFHECCDYKEPTLVIIKSSEGWIFGGYTTQSWSGYCIYNDMIY